GVGDSLRISQQVKPAAVLVELSCRYSSCWGGRVQRPPRRIVCVRCGQILRAGRRFEELGIEVVLVARRQWWISSILLRIRLRVMRAPVAKTVGFDFLPPRKLTEICRFPYWPCKRWCFRCL